MSYAGISVREAMEKLNNLNSGWYLPQVQRQYVWGARYESESYVCLLLDSLLKRFPIGGLVLWETTKTVPYRQFLRNYALGQFEKEVDSGRWGAPKSLVYDGQQRLQTLYSVLHFTFNGRVLHFDLLFDNRKAESDETGFLFRDKNAPIDVRYLKLTQLVSMQCDQREKTYLESRLLNGLVLNEDQEILVKSNLANLWVIFVDTEIKSIAYFQVRADDDSVVNEVFKRLNTGGIALTQIELVLTDIKAKHSDYEEKLWSLSKTIKEKSGGIDFSSSEILQFFHLLIKETISINSSRLKPQDVDYFQGTLQNNADTLVEVFEGYLWGLFKINNACIIPRWLAVLPIGVYLNGLKASGHKWKIKELSQDSIVMIHQYFIMSQFCDWNNQTMVNIFSGLAREAGIKGQFFPLDEIKKIAIQKNRTDTLSYNQFLSLPWLATKILTPSRTYVFHENKPQVDHIFPIALKGGDENYRQRVDVLWNFQPMPAGINNYKRARHPQEFFNSSDGAKYWQDYDYIPPAKSPIWNDEKAFIRYRHRQMRKALLNRYGLRLKRLRNIL